jgi:hypothetical protein
MSDSDNVKDKVLNGEEEQVKEELESNDVETVVEGVQKHEVSDDSEWTKVGEKKRQKSNTSETTVKEQDEDDVFQFDESESWAKKPNITIEEEPEDDHFHLDSEFEDEELDSILLVTQHHLPSPQEPIRQNLPPRKHSTTPFVRSKANTDIADMINEGLYMYEKTIGKTPKKQNEEKIIVQKRPPLADIKTNTPPVTMSPKRFVSGGITSASPPVGWLLNNQVPLSKSFESRSVEKHSYSNSFGGRSHGSHHAACSFGGRSLGKSMDHKEFQPFEHPSYQLLKEKGFVQQKYTKYHDRAVKGIE